MTQHLTFAGPVRRATTTPCRVSWRGLALDGFSDVGHYLASEVAVAQARALAGQVTRAHLVLVRAWSKATTGKLKGPQEPGPSHPVSTAADLDALAQGAAQLQIDQVVAHTQAAKVWQALTKEGDG